ncbi:META domain-containing protein [Marinobacter lacisalsi]
MKASSDDGREQAEAGKAHSSWPPELPLRAIGQEPGWILKLTEDDLDLRYQYGEKRFQAPAPKPEPTDQGYRYTATSSEGQELVLHVRDRYCTDSMSGLPYPYTATVTIENQVLEGCAGDPESLLTGTRWVVEDLNSQGIIDYSRITIEFSGNGRIQGNAGCNRYSGNYEITGEGIDVSELATTSMACAPALMKQEDRVLDTVANARRFGLSETGALELSSGPERSLKALPSD